MNKETIENERLSQGGSWPLWWNARHATAWDRVKDAMRRDWEQTKADFSSVGGTELNQHVSDTVMQVAGKEPIPALTVKTRPDDPQEVARSAEKIRREREKVQDKLASAKIDLVVARTEAQGKVAEERRSAQEEIAQEQKKLEVIAEDARDAIWKDERKGQEKLAKQQEKITELRAEVEERIAEVEQKSGEKIARQREKVSEARREWSQIEPAMRYGFGARMEYARGHTWDEKVEARLHTGWLEMNTMSTWEDARPHVRQGWDT